LLFLCCGEWLGAGSNADRGFWAFGSRRISAGRAGPSGHDTRREAPRASETPPSSAAAARASAAGAPTLAAARRKPARGRLPGGSRAVDRGARPRVFTRRAHAGRGARGLPDTVPNVDAPLRSQTPASQTPATPEPARALRTSLRRAHAAAARRSSSRRRTARCVAAFRAAPRACASRDRLRAASRSSVPAVPGAHGLCARACVCVRLVASMVKGCCVCV